MSTETPTDPASEVNDGADDVAALQERVDELEEQIAELQAETGNTQQSMVIIATKGTLDMAYPPLILASTAAAFDWDVTVFHTFWGLEILYEDNSKNLQLSSVGNPNVPVPNAIAALPGMDKMTTKIMRKRIEDNDTATIEELIETSIDMGVELQACQMTIDLMDYDENDFYDGVVTGVGAASALQRMQDADIQLLV